MEKIKIKIKGIEKMNMEANTIKIEEWKTPATDYPEKELGSVKIVHEFYNCGYYNNYCVRGYQFFEVTKKIPVTSLEIKDEKGIWETWMVDDVPHFWSMQDYARNSIGRVLVAGLGLGLVVHELLDNIDVDSIIIIERNKDVIDLISPLLPSANGTNFGIINEDFYKFINETKEQFDRIIIDIWTSGSAEETLNLLENEVKPLSYHIAKLFPDCSVVFHGFGIGW